MIFYNYSLNLCDKCLITFNDVLYNIFEKKLFRINFVIHLVIYVIFLKILSISSPIKKILINYNNCDILCDKY
jgi:hypothetical protein